MAIKEGELLHYDPLNEEIEVNLIEDDIIRDETPTAGYYAMFEYENGFRKTMYWSKKKMLAHAEKYSQAFRANGGARSLEPREARQIPEKDLAKYSGIEDHAPPDHQQMGHYEHRPAERPGQGHGSDPRGRKS